MEHAVELEALKAAAKFEDIRLQMVTAGVLDLSFAFAILLSTLFHWIRTGAGLWTLFYLLQVLAFATMGKSLLKALPPHAMRLQSLLISVIAVVWYGENVYRSREAFLQFKLLILSPLSYSFHLYQFITLIMPLVVGCALLVMAYDCWRFPEKFKLQENITSKDVHRNLLRILKVASRKKVEADLRIIAVESNRWRLFFGKDFAIGFHPSSFPTFHPDQIVIFERKALTYRIQSSWMIFGGNRKIHFEVNSEPVEGSYTITPEILERLKGFIAEVPARA